MKLESKAVEEYYRTNKDFKEFVDKCMKTYNWSLEKALESPITKEYYKYLISS